MAITQFEQLDLGKFLQIVFSDGIRNQLSTDYRDWEEILVNKVGAPNGRELRFFLQTSLGPSAVQYSGPGVNRFPKASKTQGNEFTATYKEIDTTVEVEWSVLARAQKSPAKYAEPLAHEIASKTIAAKRRLAADVYGDGTGVVGSILDVAAFATAPDTISVLLDGPVGHIGWFEYGDLLVAADQGGTVLKDSANEPVVFEVTDKSRVYTLGILDSVTLTTTQVPTNITSGAVFFYRAGQSTIPNRTSNATVGDYGTATEVMAGLQSLAAADGRTIHGMTMSGALAASETDADDLLDANTIQKMMDKVKDRVGRGAYSWNKLCMAPEAHADLIISREGDRRFHTAEDGKRGTRAFSFIHGDDTLEVYGSEFVPKREAWALPVPKSGSDKVLEYHGTDFEPVSQNGSDPFMLKPSEKGGHERNFVSYMTALGSFICKHPAAVAKLKNVGPVPTPPTP